MSCKRIFGLFLVVALLMTAAVGCGKGKKDDTVPPDPSDATLVVDGLDPEDMFTDRDMQGEDTATGGSTTTQGASASSPNNSDASTTVKTVAIPSDVSTVRLSDGASSSSAGGARVSGDTVTVTAAGTYYMQGTLKNGQIVVDATSTDKIQLVFSGVSVSNASSAPLYIKQADKVFVTLANGSQNVLSATGEFIAIDDNNIDGAVFSKDDLTFNGGGSLAVASSSGHGIVCKDSLAFTDGSYHIDAVGHAVQGKDDVRVAAGRYTLRAGKDGIHVENADDTSLGYLYIGGGDFAVTADGDGFSASGILQIDGGSGKLTVGGGAGEASSSGGMPPWGGMYGGYAGTTEDTVSAKGFKASANLLLKGGTWTVDAADDAIHSNASATVKGGSYTVRSGDDGVHADAVLLIAGGTLTVEQSYEGLEGTSVEISGGTIRVTASDDGINAAGGNDQSGYGGGMPHQDSFSEEHSRYIRISGGKLSVDAAGDGLDANGGLYVTGGETYVSGPTGSGNGALDYDGTAQVSGGIFVAVGSSGMAQGFSLAEGQGAALVNFSGSAGERLILKDSGGKTLCSFTPEKRYSCVVISCPDLSNSGSYTLSAGDNTSSFTMTDWLYGSSGGMGGSMGGGMGGRPGRR